MLHQLLLEALAEAMSRCVEDRQLSGAEAEAAALEAVCNGCVPVPCRTALSRRPSTRCHRRLLAAWPAPLQAETDLY